MERNNLKNEKKARSRIRQGIKETGKVIEGAPDWLGTTRFDDGYFLIIEDSLAMPLLPPSDDNRAQTRQRPFVAVTCMNRRYKQRNFGEGPAASSMMKAFEQAISSLSGTELLSRITILDQAVSDYARIHEVSIEDAGNYLEHEVTQAEGLTQQTPEWLIRTSKHDHWVILDADAVLILESDQMGRYKAVNVVTPENQLHALEGLSGQELSMLVHFLERPRQEYVARLTQEVDTTQAAKRMADIVAKQGVLSKNKPSWADTIETSRTEDENVWPVDAENNEKFYIQLGHSRFLEGKILTTARRPLFASEFFQRDWQAVDLTKLTGIELNEPLLTPKALLKQYRQWRHIGEKRAPRMMREEISAQGKIVSERPAWVPVKDDSPFFLVTNDAAYSIKYEDNPFGRPWVMQECYPKS